MTLFTQSSKSSSGYCLSKKISQLPLVSIAMEALDETSRIGRFSDLSGSYHSAASKVLLCEEYFRSELSPDSFARTHSIPPTSMKRMIAKYKDDQESGISTFRDSGSGRPRKLDKVGGQNVLTELAKRTRDQHAPNRAEFQAILIKEVEQSSKRRNIANVCPTIVPKTMWNYKSILKLGLKTAQLKTHARITAEGDPRNSFSMAVMNKAFSEKLHSSMIINWDATQYGISPDKDDMCVYLKGKDVGPLTSESGGGTYLSVKHYHLHNANGTVAPPVFIIADDSVDAESFAWHDIPELSTSTDVNGHAYLCVCRTRNANAAFYRWFGTFIVAPFIIDVRARSKAKYPDGTPMRAFVTCDGEQEQIRVFQEEDMLGVFENALIDFGKIAASCSGIHQSSDVSPLFRAIKKKIQSVETTNYKSPLMSEALKDVLRGCGYSSAMKTKISDSIQKIVKTIRSVMTAEMIITGYERTGQYPVDFARTLRQTTYTFSIKQWSSMTNAVDDAVAIFRARGALSEDEMDTLEIPSVNEEQVNQRPKDQRMLHQQRAVIMNSVDCIAKYKNHYENKELGVIEKVAARQRREIAKDAAKEIKEKKKIERDAFNNLPAAEKKAIRKSKRDAAAAAKILTALVAAEEQAKSSESDDDLDIFADEDLYDCN